MTVPSRAAVDSAANELVQGLVDEPINESDRVVIRAALTAAYAIDHEDAYAARKALVVDAIGMVASDIGTSGTPSALTYEAVREVLFACNRVHKKLTKLK